MYNSQQNSRSAAGLRRSAVVERIRLREEWSALKETNDNIQPRNVKARNIGTAKANNKQRAQKPTAVGDVLSGVVALVEVGTEGKALPLRAALTALGATVVPTWNPLVTHLIWSEGGCRLTRARARALASRLVSPLWVEACASSARRLPEHLFPASARASDLPSPRTLKKMLKKAEQENLTLFDLLCDSNEDMDGKKTPRLRISSDTDHDTSNDKSTDKSHDKSRDTTDPESRVNTARRRPQPREPDEAPKGKSRRKLFTAKEADVMQSSDDDKDTTAVPKRMQLNKLTQPDGVARAKQMARRLAGQVTEKQTQGCLTQINTTPRIVLTGMSNSERRIVYNAIRSLNGRVFTKVSKKTTHVLLGSCKQDMNVCDDTNNLVTSTNISKMPDTNISLKIERCDKKSRTLNALEGAVRGCRVLYAQWALDCLAEKQWIHHYGYEVKHLKKMSQKARIERAVLGKQNSEYAYDVFCGMRVFVKPNAEMRDPAIHLLKLCGAVVQDGGESQNGRQQSAGSDITIGIQNDEIASRWIFDSVAASRMRTTRRYINSAVTCSGDDVFCQLREIHR